jgi:hypothetical protein
MGTGLPLGVQNQTNQIGQFKQLIIGAGSNVFKANTSGIFCGQTNYSAAPLRWDYSGNFYASSAIISGNITATGGSITGSFDITTTGGQIKAYNDITSTHGAINAYNGFSSSNGGLSVYNDIVSTHGGLTIQNDIVGHGKLTIGDDSTFSKSITASNDISSSGGSIHAYNDIYTDHGSMRCSNTFTCGQRLTVNGGGMDVYGGDIFNHDGNVHTKNDFYSDNGQCNVYNDITTRNGKFICNGHGGVSNGGFTIVTSVNFGNQTYGTHQFRIDGGIITST